jgi:hypothetical protein
MDDTKLATFLSTHKLNTMRLLAASHQLETLRKEDREAKLARRRAKGAEGGEGAEKKETKKPRSGRPMTPRALETALAGGAVSGPTKQRILRAVNHLLEQKKKDKIDLRALF